MTNINIISFFIGKILKKFPFFKETFAALLFIYYQGFSMCIRLVGRFSFTKLAFPVLQFGEWAAAGLQEHRHIERQIYDIVRFYLFIFRCL